MVGLRYSRSRRSLRKARKNQVALAPLDSSSRQIIALPSG